jgi:hypothetical protein
VFVLSLPVSPKRLLANNHSERETRFKPIFCLQGRKVPQEKKQAARERLPGKNVYKNRRPRRGEDNSSFYVFHSKFFHSSFLIFHSSFLIFFILHSSLFILHFQLIFVPLASLCPSPKMGGEMGACSPPLKGRSGRKAEVG